MNEFLNSVFLLNMQHAIKYIKLKLNDPYPFDEENRYYKFVPKIVWLVVVFHVLVEIKFSKSLEYKMFFNINSGYFYFMIFAIVLYITLEIENHLTLKKSITILKQKGWRLKNQLIISFRLGLLCYFYLLISIIIFQIKLSGIQPSFFILFLKTISITTGLTLAAFLYDFYFFNKSLLNEEMKRRKFETTNIDEVIKDKTPKLTKIIEIHPAFIVDVNAIICCYSELNYVYFITTQKPRDPVKIKITFKEVEEMFLPYHFYIKCNRGLLVNFNFLETIKTIEKTKFIYLKQIDKPFPISRNYYSKVDLYLTKT